MTAAFAPEICRLIEELALLVEGKLPGDSCREALADACECHTRSRHRARVVAACVRDQAELAAQLEARLEEREEILGKLERELHHRAVLVNLVYRLQEVSYHIAGLGQQLEAARQALPPDAPHPGLDEAIKVARAVVAGQAPPLFLQARLEELVELHDRLAQEEALFARFYPRHADLATPTLEALQAGVGAVVEGELDAAVPYLEAAGVGLARLRHERRQVRARDGLSEVSPLDTLGWLARTGGPELAEHLAHLAAWHDRLGPPAYPDAGWDKAVRPAWEKFGAARAQASGERALRELVRLGEDLIRRHRAWLADPPPPRSLAKDPHWHQLREALVGWHQGVVPRPTVLARLAHARAEAEALELRLADRPPAERAGLLAAVRTPLALFTELERAERGEVPLLVSRLEGCFDRWLWARDAGAGAAAPAPGPETLLARLKLARGTERLRPLLAGCHQQNREARRQLLQWQATAKAPARLAQLALGMAGACAELDRTLTELLENDDSPTLADHDEVLDHICAQLVALAEAQERLVNSKA